MNPAPVRVEGGRAWQAGFEPDLPTGYRVFLRSPEGREVAAFHTPDHDGAKEKAAILLRTAEADEVAAKKARVAVKLVGADGNALNLLGLCIRAARRAGWSQGVIDAFTASAKAGDYDHLLRTCMDWFDVR